MATVSTQSRQAKGKKKATRLEGPDISAYARLRCVLDTFEGMALHYFSRGANSNERKKRAKEIEKRVRAFQDVVKKSEGTNDCPDGWCDCEGLCIQPPCTCPHADY